jgi:type III secretory pathway component EscR
MAVILLSYFSAMVTAFVALMFVLTNVFGSITVHQVRPEPHHISAAARAMVLQHYAAADAKHGEDSRIQVAALSPAAPQKATPDAGSDHVTQTAAKQTQKANTVRLARNEQRKEHPAEWQLGQGHSPLAMGYAPESREQLAAARIFNTVGSH